MSKPARPEELPFEIPRQPDDTTCGPTCLHALYRFHGRPVALDRLIAEIPVEPNGGTLGVHLANDALARGHRVTLYTWNLELFDPTWFAGEVVLRERLERRLEACADRPRLLGAGRAYQRFLDAGGELRLADLEPALLRRFLRRGLPLLTGLSATFLYREARQGPDEEYDDVGGDPVGHFVILSGYRPGSREVLVSDPMHPNPLADRHTYPVRIERVVGAIYLGVLTYDANLVVVEPGAEAGEP